MKFIDENFGKKMGQLVRATRIQNGLSLEELAEETGISKITLGQIERGKANNPTISVLWKISKSLSVPITTLLSMNSDVSIITHGQKLNIVSSNNNFMVEPLFNSNDRGFFETYLGYIQPHSKYDSEPHSAGVIEYITVIEGALELHVQDQIYKLNKYDSVSFNGDQLHSYENPTSSITSLYFVISYSNNKNPQSILFNNK